MKLFYAPTSPYVRKVMVLLLETGLDAKVERLTGSTTPMAANPTLAAMNPLGKLPALELDSGETLYDSRVICEYIDTVHGGGRFFPASGAARWTALRRQALGDGLLDAALLVRYEETARPAEKRWADWSNGQWGKVTRAIDVIEGEATNFGSTFDIGTVALVCALDYVDLRFPERDWRPARAKTAAWLKTISARPSLRQTVPPKG